MLDTLVTWQFWAIFVPLMLAIRLLVFYTKKHYYKQGVEHGFVIGVNKTVMVLAQEDMLKDTKDTRAVVKKIAPVIVSNLVNRDIRKAGYES